MYYYIQSFSLGAPVTSNVIVAVGQNSLTMARKSYLNQRGVACGLPGGGGGYSTLSWVRMCGPKFRPPP